jgi:hypothetical protein
MGNIENISNSLLSTIIFCIAVLELVVILVAKIYCVRQSILILIMRLVVCLFLSVSSMILLAYYVEV